MKLILALCLAVALAACGGGGDSQGEAVQSESAIAQTQAAAVCPLEPIAAGIEITDVRIDPMSYTYPLSGGVQAHTLAPMVVGGLRSTDPAIPDTPRTVQITLTATRRLDTPTTMVGAASLDLWVETINLAGDVSRATTAGCERAIDAQWPGASTVVGEAHRFTVTIPAGDALIIRSVARLTSEAGSTGPIVLGTTDFQMSAIYLP